MTDQHTPGPWKYCGCGKCGNVYAPASNVAIATALSYEEDVPTPDDATRVANARLIAAAPLMLEALRAVVGFVTDDSTCIDCGHEEYAEDGRLVSLPRETHAATCSVPAALAAIAAATGEDD